MNNKLSIISAIEEALNRFLSTFDEYPGMVLLGPPEMTCLIEELTTMRNDLTANECFRVCDMLVVPKISAGIDFQISARLSQNLLLESPKKFLAENYN